MLFLNAFLKAQLQIFFFFLSNEDFNTLTSAMTSARPGLHMTSQRLGVMPLVLF